MCLSGKQLAIQIGISKHALEKYENAGVMPGYAAALKILQFFQLTALEDISQADLARNTGSVIDSENSYSPNNDNKKNNNKGIDSNVVYFKALLAEKEKRIVHLEEMVQLLREQIHLLRRK